MFNRPLRLRCQVMNYPWGRYAQDSAVFRLSGESAADEKTPFAELWIGAHPKASAELSIDGQEHSLEELIRKQPIELLGPSCYQRFGAALPFLLKVLSVRTALSIQAHPDKDLAEVLHTKDPAKYPDANHKPELAIALGPVSLLYGFRPLSEIRTFFKKTPELQALIGEEFAAQVLVGGAQDALRKLYSAVMNAEPALIQEQCQKLCVRLRGAPRLLPEERWVLKLGPEYPEGDVGLFNFYLLNLRTLKPGEAIFVQPNTVHAYLEGEIIECMANSDNVIRAGLTGKCRDTNTLLSMLEYKETSVPIIQKNNLGQYETPVSEFAVRVIEGNVTEQISANNAQAQVLFCVKGEGEIFCVDAAEKITPGSAFFVPAGSEDCKLSLKNAFLISVAAAK